MVYYSCLDWNSRESESIEALEHYTLLLLALKLNYDLGKAVHRVDGQSQRLYSTVRDGSCILDVIHCSGIGVSGASGNRLTTTTKPTCEKENAIVPFSDDLSGMFCWRPDVHSYRSLMIFTLFRMRS